METCRKLNGDDKDWRRLNRALQRYSLRSDIRAKLQKLSPHVAESEREGCQIRVKIDPDTAPKLQSYLHELLHWYYEKHTEGVPYSIHEGWIQKTEDQLWEFISRDKRRVNWWRREINQFLG